MFLCYLNCLLFTAISVENWCKNNSTFCEISCSNAARNCSVEQEGNLQVLEKMKKFLKLAETIEIKIQFHLYLEENQLAIAFNPQSIIRYAISKSEDLCDQIIDNFIQIYQKFETNPEITSLLQELFSLPKFYKKTIDHEMQTKLNIKIQEFFIKYFKGKW